MGKQTIVHPCIRVLLGDKKEYVIDTYNMDEMQNYYVATKETKEKRIFPVTIPIIGNSRKCKLIYSNREQISSYLGKEGEKEEWISKKNKETFEGDE